MGSSTVIALVVLMGQRYETQMLAAVLGLVFVYPALALLLVGIVQLVVSLIGLLPKGSGARRLATIVAVAIPMTMVGWGFHAYFAHERARAVALATFRGQTLAGSFGGYTVSLPAAPSVTVVHACRDGRSECHTNLRTARELNMASPDDLRLSRIRFRLSDGVEEDLSVWCGTRPEMANAPWCQDPFRYHVELHVEEPGVPLAVAAENGFPTSDGMRSDGVKDVVCNEHWTGLSCRVIFDVASGIEGYVFTSGLSPEKALEVALVEYRKLDRLWTYMTSDDPVERSPDNTSGVD